MEPAVLCKYRHTEIHGHTASFVSLYCHLVKPTFDCRSLMKLHSHGWICFTSILCVLFPGTQRLTLHPWSSQSDQHVNATAQRIWLLFHVCWHGQYIPVVWCYSATGCIQTLYWMIWIREFLFLFFPTEQSLRLSCYQKKKKTAVDCYPLPQSIHYNKCNYKLKCVQAMGSDGWSSKLIWSSTRGQWSLDLRVEAWLPGGAVAASHLLIYLRAVFIVLSTLRRKKRNSH